MFTIYQTRIEVSKKRYINYIDVFTGLYERVENLCIVKLLENLFRIFYK
ncbi:hypothetical protein TPHV1_200048 [Treponema phagedenis]|uniref:Uncharacterized protein n=1 Tax=Treponema phagedenis TaxID=162 RepID=A0A0B7GTE3_TREPH|nr:hypothetical protein TPHV1_200048 [Treponema phagedenis]